MSLLRRLEKTQEIQHNSSNNERFSSSHKPVNEQLKFSLHEKLLAEIDEDMSQNREKEGKNVSQEEVKDIATRLVEETAGNLSMTERQRLIKELLSEVLGYGPLDTLLEDSEVSEVMVNQPKQVYMEKNGKLVLSNVTFRDEDHILHIIERIVAPIGRRIDESMPMVDARLPDGSRVNAIIPPLALKGPSLTIRKFAKDPFTVEDLIRFGTLTKEMAEFLRACVRARLNVVVSGGTGSGKTTTLNVLSSFIPDDERIVTIEDAAELQLRQDHVVTLETRPPNVEGKGSITMRDLVKNSLRMRPDRVVVGEVRGGEALDMLQAMNTGHDGSLTTGHANSPRDILSRLETMVLMAGMDLPLRAIRQQIASAVDLIVQQSRLKDGSRKITYVTEVAGMEGDIITLQDIFLYKQEGIDERKHIVGELKPTGIRPKFMERLELSGIHLPNEIFQVGFGR